MATKFKMTPEQKSLFDALPNLTSKVCINSLSGMSDIDSYLKAKGLSKSKVTEKQRLTAEACVSRMLSNAKARAFLDSMKEVAVNNAIMSREEMMERLTSISRVTISDLVEWSAHSVTDNQGNEAKQTVWSIKDSAMQDEVAMATISEVATGKDGLKIKQHSPLAAMKQLAELAGYDAPTKSEVKNVTDTGENEW